MAHVRAVDPCTVIWTYRAVPRSEAEAMYPDAMGGSGDTGEGAGTGTSGTGDTGSGTGSGTSGTGDTGSGTGTGDTGSGTGTGTTGTGDTGSGTGTGTTGTTGGQPQVPGGVVQGAVCGVYTGVSVAPGGSANPWDTAEGQNCFEKWIREFSNRLNAYDGTDDFNARKPWHINEYGLMAGNPPIGPHLGGRARQLGRLQ